MDGTGNYLIVIMAEKSTDASEVTMGLLFFLSVVTQTSGFFLDLLSLSSSSLLLLLFFKLHTICFDFRKTNVLVNLFLEI